MRAHCFVLLLCAVAVNASTISWNHPMKTTTTNYAHTTGLLDQGTVVMSSGVLTSPGYPNNYPPNVDKKVSIRLPLHSSIEIHFHRLDTQDCFDCRCDFVELTFFSRFCGGKLPDALFTSNTRTEYFEVRFHSDGNDERSGFYLTYNIYMPTTTNYPSTTPCSYTPCDPNCPPERRNDIIDHWGCGTCTCDWPVAATTPSVSGSLLLNILLNLKTEAEAMELQAKSVKETAIMAIGMAQQGRWRK